MTDQNKVIKSRAAVFGLCLIAAALPTTASEAVDLSEFNLVFSDEFNGSNLDSSKWNTGYLWGPYLSINNEEQLYVDEFGINAGEMQGAGGNTPSPFEMTGTSLKIKAIPVDDATQIPARPAENDPIWNNFPEYRYNGDDPNDPNDSFYDPANVNYLSGLITSYDTFRFTHGYAEARVRLPEGQGLWPAFWLLTSFYVEDVPEIDIMEFLGHDTDTVYHTYHYFEPQNGWNQVSTPSFTTDGPDFTDGWYTFSVAWDPKEIVWYVDGVETRRITDQEYTIPNQAMYVLANVAVGGNWPGSPDNTTPFPAEYELDYIRVYQKDSPNVITQAALDSDYILMFEDDFDGSSLDTTKWNTHHLWGPYWQINNEEQFYPDVGDTHGSDTFNSPPISVSNGTLKITADSIDADDLPNMPSLASSAFQNHPEWRHSAAYNDPDFTNPTNDPTQAHAPFLPKYTSGILTSYDSFKFTHGYAEISAKLPQGSGLWPAFWLLNGYYVDQQPEIDIIELRGANPNELVHSYHLTPRDGGPPSFSWTTTNNNQDGFADGFHKYGVAWEPGKIDFYVDGVKQHTHTGASVSSQNMYAILNLAVGGNFVADVDPSLMPVDFEIDYLKVYQQSVASSIVSLPPADTTDPTGTVTQPLNGSEIEPTASYDLEGTYGDDQSGVAWLRTRIQRLGVSPAEYWNGSSWTSSVSWLDASLADDGSWSLSGVDFSEEGRYRIRLNIRDNAENVASPTENPLTDIDVVAAVIPDTTDPTGTVTQPLHGSEIEPAASYDLAGTYGDDQSGVAWLRTRIQRLGVSPAEYWNGSSWTSSVSWLDASLADDGSWSLSGVDFSEEGRYRIRLNIRDNAENVASPTENPLTDIDVVAAVIPDTTDPTGTVTQPLNGSQIQPTASYDLEGTYGDDQSGVAWLRTRIQRLGVSPSEYWNGTIWAPGVTWLDTSLAGDGSWSLSGVDLSEDGQYRIRLNIRDNAGNTVTPSESVLIDFSVSPD